MPVTLRKPGIPLPTGIRVLTRGNLSESAQDILVWLERNTHVESQQRSTLYREYYAKTELGQILLRLIASRSPFVEEVMPWSSIDI